MEINKASTNDLLSILLGKKTDLKDQSLSELFGLRERRQKGFCVSEEIIPYKNKLLVARELVKRAIEEKFVEAPVELSSPVFVKHYLLLLLGGQEFESFVALWLNAQKKLVAATELFRGTTTQTSVYPREVVRDGLKFNASAVIFAHNHPSGSHDPSKADMSLTTQLRQALAFIDVKVLDHFIVAGTDVVSFAENGLI